MSRDYYHPGMLVNRIAGQLRGSAEGQSGLDTFVTVIHTRFQQYYQLWERADHRGAEPRPFATENAHVQPNQLDLLNRLFMFNTGAQVS